MQILLIQVARRTAFLVGGPPGSSSRVWDFRGIAFNKNKRFARDIPETLFVARTTVLEQVAFRLRHPSQNEMSTE
eukprot:1126858-Pyramimonas_sp.AAC.1